MLLHSVSDFLKDDYPVVMPIKHAKLIVYLIDCSNVINNAIFKYQIAVPLYTVFRSVRTFKQNPIFIAAEFEKRNILFPGFVGSIPIRGENRDGKDSF